MASAEDILASVTNLWRRQFQLADEAKRDRFGRVAQRCWDFLGEDYDKLYLPPEDEEFPAEPDYKLRRNLTFDFVATFLPFVFHQIPHRGPEDKRSRLLRRLPQLCAGHNRATGRQVPARC